VDGPGNFLRLTPRNGVKVHERIAWMENQDPVIVLARSLNRFRSEQLRAFLDGPQGPIDKTTDVRNMLEKAFRTECPVETARILQQLALWQLRIEHTASGTPELASQEVALLFRDTKEERGLAQLFKASLTPEQLVELCPPPPTTRKDKAPAV